MAPSKKESILQLPKDVVFTGKRKHIRMIIRLQAERESFKPSKTVHELWTRYQTNKNGKAGYFIRQRNVARGTHPKHTWKNRYGMASK